MATGQELLRQAQENMQRGIAERRARREARLASRLAGQASAAPQQPIPEVVNPNIPATAPVTGPPAPPALPDANKRGIDFGSWPGSGIAENIVSGAQSFSETVGGTVANLASPLPGTTDFEKKFAEVEAERGKPGFFEFQKQGELRAEAFRRADFPTLDLPGEGFDPIPGKGEFRLFDTVGVKGALELTPDVMLAIATGGTGGVAAAVRGGTRGISGGLARTTGRVARDVSGIDALTLSFRAGKKGFRNTRAGVDALRGKRAPWNGATGLFPDIEDADSAFKRAGAKEVPTTGDPESTALVPLNQTGATGTSSSAAVYAEGGRKGWMGWAQEKVVGFQSVFNPANLLERKLWLWAVRDQERAGKVAPTSALIKARQAALTNKFVKDDAGRIINIGHDVGAEPPLVASGTTGSPPPRRPDATVTSRRATAGEPLGGEADLSNLSDDDLNDLLTKTNNSSTRERIIEEMVARDTGTRRSSTRRQRPRGPSGNRVTVETTTTTGGPQVEGKVPQPRRKVALETSQVFEDAFQTGKLVSGKTGTIEDLRELTGKEYEAAFARLSRQSEKPLEPGTRLLKNDQFGYIFTQDQAEFIQLVHNVIEDSKSFMGKYGVIPGNTILEGIGSNYTPRRVIAGLLREADRIQQGRTNIGKNQTWAQSRSYYGQAIEDGVAGGLRYEDDISAVMEAYMTGVYRAVADKELEEAIKVLALNEKQARKAIRAGVDVKSVSFEGRTPPLLAGKFFEKDVADALKKFISPTGATLRTIGNVGDIARTARASTDFSAPFIQGILLLANSPKKWAQGMPGMFRAFWNEDYYNRWMAGNVDQLIEAAQDGVIISGRSEFFAGLEPLQRGANKIPVIGKPLAKGFSKFERAFTFYGDYARFEMWKALKPTAAKAGPKGMQDLADFVNRATGVFTPGALVVSPSQQALERMFIFFAPRYTRAALSLVTDIGRGGLRGEQARTSLMRLAAGGLATYALTAQAMGQKPQFDPAAPGFLRLKVGGDNIGLGTVWRSMVTLAADIYTDPLFNGRVSESQLAFQQGRFGEKDLSNRIQDNQLIRWARSRTSVISGASIDIFNGHDFIGNPIEGPKDWAAHLGSQALPFIIEDIFMSTPRRSGAIASASSLFGLSSYPMSLSQRRRELSDKLAVAEHGKLWGDLNKLEQERLIASDERLADLIEESRKDRVSKGRDLDVLIQEWFDSVEESGRIYNQQIENAYQAVLANPEQNDLTTFRRVSLKKFGNDRRAAIDSLSTNPRLKPVEEWFEERRVGGGAVGQDPERPEDIAYQEYLDTVAFNPEFDKDTGEFDFDGQRNAESGFRERWGEDVYNYVQTVLAEGKDVPLIVQELHEGRRKFSYYWGSVDNPNTSLGAVISNRPDPILAKEVYRQYVNASTLVQEEMTRTDPEIRRILDQLGKVRAALRRREPELDVFLTRWGYTTRLLSRENQFAGALGIVHDPRPRPNHEGQFDFTISGSRQQLDAAAG